MQTKTKTQTDLDHTPMGGGEVAIRNNHAVAPSARQADRPPALADLGTVALSARRFMARPEINATFSMGSAGLAVHLPANDQDQLRLFEALPRPGACWRLEELLRHELATPITAAEANRAVAALVAGFPTGARASNDYQVGLATMVAELAAIEYWPRSAVIGGLIRVLANSTFLPSVAEVVEAIADERRFLVAARITAGRAAAIYCELEDHLAAAGLIEGQVGGEF